MLDDNYYSDDDFATLDDIDNLDTLDDIYDLDDNFNILNNFDKFDTVNNLDNNLDHLDKFDNLDNTLNNLNNNLDKFDKFDNLDKLTEDMQLKAAISLSLSTKQPVYTRPGGPIYKIDHIIYDTIVDCLISNGCMKLLSYFMVTRTHYYNILFKKYNEIYSQMDMKIRIIPFQYFKDFYKIIEDGIAKDIKKVFWFKMLGSGIHAPNLTFTCDSFILAAKCDKCLCVMKKEIIHMRHKSHNCVSNCLSFHPEVTTDVNIFLRYVGAHNKEAGEILFINKENEKYVATIKNVNISS